jgi:hypothetical protein
MAGASKIFSNPGITAATDRIVAKKKAVKVTAPSGAFNSRF